MTLLAAQSDVEALLGRPLTATELNYFPTQLANASGKVADYCRQQIAQTLGDVLVLPGNWGPRLVLPQRPVTNIVSISVNGTALIGSSYVWDRYGNVDVLSGSFSPDASSTAVGPLPQLWGPAGSVYANSASGPSWFGPNALVTVTYDHGYAVIPQTVVNEVAGMVASQLSVPIGVLKEKIGGYDVNYIRPPGGGMNLTDEGKRALNQFRKRTASTRVGLRR